MIRIFCRDIREYKSRVESYSREMLRKEGQVRDLQQRLENGEGKKISIIHVEWQRTTRGSFSS